MFIYFTARNLIGLFIGCGMPAEGRSVSNSSSGKIQEWPWMAALYHKQQFEQGIEQHFCGGALITDSHILTAAHCTQGLVLI